MGRVGQRPSVEPLGDQVVLQAAQGALQEGQVVNHSVEDRGGLRMHPEVGQMPVDYRPEVVLVGKPEAQVEQHPSVDLQEDQEVQSTSPLLEAPEV